MGKDKIIGTIRKNASGSKSLPEPQTAKVPGTTTALLASFKASLQQVGATYVELTEPYDAFSNLNARFPDAENFRNKDLWEEYPASCSKNKLSQLDSVILEGQFGVAENGAIWLDDSNFPNRIIPFIAEHLIICLDPGKIVLDMHQAHALLGKVQTGFGVFISGPSKTADIEQNLVFGAHGAKELTVLIGLK